MVGLRPEGLCVLLAARDLLFRAQVRLNLLRADQGFKLKEVEGIDQVLTFLGTSSFDCVLTTETLADGDAAELLTVLRQRSWRLPVIVLAATPDAGRALLPQGAADWIPAEAAGDPLVPRTLQYAVHVARVRRALFQARAQLDASADRDALTELRNRRGLERALDVVLERARTVRGARPTAVLLDCANLRWFNESFGYATGDQLLRKVAAGLRGLTRTEAVLGRLGGGEFLLLLPATPLADATEIAASLARDIRALRLRRTGSTPVEVRAAVAELDRARSLRSLVDIFHLALSLRTARTVGKVVVVEAERNRLREMARWKATLRGGAELHVLRQPAFSLKDGRCAFYELLIRGPRGLEQPRELFAIARELGISEEIDLLCLRTCLEANRDVAEPLCLHVNILPATLVNTPLSRLLEALRARGRHKLFLDVDCRQLGEDAAKVAGVADTLRQEGVQLALDHVDFANASTEAVLTLKPQAVKTHPELVRGLRDDPTKSVLLRELIATAEFVGAHLIALGLEDAEDRRHIEELGFAYGQGFLLGKPHNGGDDDAGHWTDRFED